MSDATVINNREQLFTPDRMAVRYTTVTIDGMTFRLQSMSDKVWTRIQASAVKRDGTMDKMNAQMVSAMIIVESVVDEQGNRVFTEADIRNFRDMDAGFVARLADACRTHIGIQETEEVKN